MWPHQRILVLGSTFLLQWSDFFKIIALNTVVFLNARLPLHKLGFQVCCWFLCVCVFCGFFCVFFFVCVFYGAGEQAHGLIHPRHAPQHCVMNPALNLRVLI